MKLVIIGSRSLKDHPEVLRKIDAILNHHLLELEFVTSGGADGPDTHAEEAAKQKGIPFKREDPIGPPGPKGWHTHYKPRNLRLIEHVRGPNDHLVAFLDRTSGTYGAGWTADEYERLTGKRAERYYLTPETSLGQ